MKANFYDILETRSFQYVLSVASFEAMQEGVLESEPESSSSLTIPSSPQAKVAPTMKCAA